MNNRRSYDLGYHEIQRRENKRLAIALTVDLVILVAFFGVLLYYVSSNLRDEPAPRPEQSEVEKCQRQGYATAVRDLRHGWIACYDPLTAPAQPAPARAKLRTDG